ncbi:rhomboid-like protein [Mycobacterium conspicuum]|uniref:Uncharacterized protein n=1 Tax=Mycobacterium conspicuum TaxID=44010 RepID=A0A1X1SW76_9MYCO|nr:rhomboid-like protein [Mycobacterium conspicuum]ORV35173.1 hypothetical protein AWC00_01190 [Mycobacterium conspicuum]BBZ42066.1 hypothetical protein MCNS_51290 [Mycobacterium conspicuum]
MTIARALSGAAAVRVTTLYAVALVTVSVTLAALGPEARDVAVTRMSTNLHNLAHGHLGTLVGSAFVEGGPVYAWLPGLVCLLALGELIWRSRGLLIAFTLGHIGATLLVAVGLTAAVKMGWVPVSITRASDVGISYGAVCVIGALTASIPSRWRPIWIGWWLGVAAVVAWAADFDFTAVGHVLALLLGVGVSLRLPSIDRWQPLHLVLLVNGVVFGYFMVSGSSAVAPLGGLAGMLLATLAGRNLWPRNDLESPGLPAPCDALSPASR